ncbi:MAG: hypothetical protein WAO13_16745, partial [Pseudolabrys sp.]
QRRGAVAVPVVRPIPSRNVVVPLLLVVAVPVVLPIPSRNVVVPLLLVAVTVVWLRSLRKMVWFCAPAGPRDCPGRC